ncbi:hypothetical protein LCGC14_2821870, partial [marine sediment metagenome]
EVMSRETMRACLDVLERTEIPTLDVTGGAPEMNPNFPWLVAEARRLDRHVIDRCNLTILLAPGFDHVPDMLAESGVEIVASLPCYLAENVDLQRGDRVFEKSIRALQLLNSLGYGQPQSRLRLNLVYNPPGSKLPPPQAALEEDYRSQLRRRYGVEFNGLFTMTNMPIGRFLEELARGGQYDEYMQTLIGAFNPAAAAGVMCRTTLSVDWTGRLHDCDFNQILELGLAEDLPQKIGHFDHARLARRRISTGQHCYGCTAGAGSSCRGTIE